MILGNDSDEKKEIVLETEDEATDDLLNSLYNSDSTNHLAKSQKKIKTWLKGIRETFPPEVVKIMQHDALEKKGLQQLLLQPEILESVEPDVSLVATILELSELMPDASKSAAKNLVHRLVQELEKKLKPKVFKAFQKSNSGISKRIKPGNHKLDWKKTIGRNLKHYHQDLQKVIPEQWFGFTKSYQLPELFIVIDTSESMTDSAVYASIVGSILASLRTIRTHLIYFSDEVTDLTEISQDPVALLFSLPLGGGTDIAQAMHFVAQKMRNPKNSFLFLISDMDEYGSLNNLLAQVQSFQNSGLTMKGILAINDSGKFNYNTDIAHKLAALGMNCISCSPDLFPEIIAAEMNQ